MNYYALIDSHFDEHPKYLNLGAAEMGLIACAITYANRTLSDGRIPRRWPEVRFGASAKKPTATLVKEGIWKVREDGDYEIVGYLDHNMSRQQVRERSARLSEYGRKGAVAKREAWPPAKPRPEPRPLLRAKPEDELEAKPLAKPEAQLSNQIQSSRPMGLSQDRGRLSDVDPPLDETPSEIRISAERPRNATDDGAFGGAVAAWAEGVRSVTGKMFLPPGGGSTELSRLVLAITASCPDMGKRIEWARENAIAFTRDAITRQPCVINVYRFIDWLNDPLRPVNGSGPTIATATSPEERYRQVVREEANADAEHARRNEGAVRASELPEPLSVTLARLRAAQGQR